MTFAHARRLGAGLVFSFVGFTAAAAPFIRGDIVVYRIGDGTAALSNNGNAVFLDEYAPDGTLVQAIPMPTLAAGTQKALLASGTAATDGSLSRSDNGNCLAVPGYGRDIGSTANLVTAVGVPRVVGRVDALGNVDTSTALTDAFPADNYRSATSSNCSDFWVGGAAASGVFRYAAFGATTSTGLTASAPSTGRVVAVQGGQLYADASVTAIRTVGTIGSGMPTTGGQALTALPGLPNTIGGNNGQPWQFFLARLAAGPGGFDTIYIADDASGVLKFSLVGATWVARGSAGAGSDTYRGLAGVVEGTTVTLYAVRGGGNQIVKIVDTGGSGTMASTITVLVASPGTNKTFRGIAMAPQVTVTPSAGAHGTISPATPQVASGGGTQSFTVTPDAGFSAAVGGTCGGTLSGSTFTTNALSRNCTVEATFVPIPTFTVTTIAGPNGTIDPVGPVTLLTGATKTFTISPSPGYAFTVGGTCGGTLSGNQYTIAPISADCTVQATFTLITFTVTPGAGPNGTITPSTPQTIALNTTAAFDLSPAFGFGVAVGGTCGGTLAGTHYTTHPIVADCTVDATFPPLPRYAVTPSASGHGTVSPATPQTIIQGQPATFTVTPDAGYNAAVRGTCGGSWSGNVYTTKPVAGDCTVSIVFARKLVLFVGNSYTFGRVDPVMSYNAANVSDLTLQMWLDNPVGTNDDEPHPWGGIPGVFKKLTDQAGLEYDVSISARNAASLRGHYLNSNPAGWDLRGNVASQRFDIVMLQDLSDEPLPAGRGANASLPFFDAYVDKLERWAHVGAAETYTETQLFGGGNTAACQAITGNSASQCDRVQSISPANGNARADAEVYLYATWARPDMIGPHGTNGPYYSAAEGIEAMTADLHNAYFNRAVANGHIEDVSPVGDAFLRAVLDGTAMRDPYAPEPGKVNLWHTDFFHPSKYGSYLSALVHFQTITGINPLALGRNEQAAADLGIAPDIAVKLQRAAQAVVLADTIAPVTTASVSSPPNAAGWNRGDVTVTLSATDTGGSLLDSVSYTLSGAQSGSGSFASTGSFTVSAEGATTVTYFAADRAGNVEAAHTLTLSIDRTAPVTTATASPAPNAAGWNRQDVTVSLAASDAGGSQAESVAYALSGAQTGSGSFAANGAITIGAEGVTTVTYFATDRAGNVEAARTLRVSIDKTAPVTTASVSVPPNPAGWNHENVTVTFTATDGGSSVDAVSYSLSGAQAGSGSNGPVTIAAEGVTTVTYFATDRAGNTESAHTLRISIDKSGPSIAGMPGASCSLWPPNHKMVTVATVSASDGGAGLASFNVTATSSEAAPAGQSDVSITGTGTGPRAIALRAERDGNGPGRTYTIVANATDLAGNSVSATAACVVPHDQGK